MRFSDIFHRGASGVEWRESRMGLCDLAVPGFRLHGIVCGIRTRRAQ